MLPTNNLVSILHRAGEHEAAERIITDLGTRLTVEPDGTVRAMTPQEVEQWRLVQIRNSKTKLVEQAA